MVSIVLIGSPSNSSGQTIAPSVGKPTYSDKYRGDGASLDITNKRILRYEDGDPAAGVHIAAIWMNPAHTIGSSWEYCAHLEYTISDSEGRYKISSWDGRPPSKVLFYAPGRERVRAPFIQGSDTSEPRRFYVIRSDDDRNVPPATPMAGPYSTSQEAVAASGSRNIYLQTFAEPRMRLGGLGLMLYDLACIEPMGSSSPTVLPFIDAMTEEIQRLALALEQSSGQSASATIERTKGIFQRARARALQGTP